MEKSLSIKLAARRQIRYTTILAGLVLAFMLGSMFIVKNPSGSDAATLLAQALTTSVGGAGAVYAPTNNTTYIIGGYPANASRVQKISMALTGNGSSISTISSTSPCFKMVNRLYYNFSMDSFYDSTSRKIYVIGTDYSTSGYPVNITELDTTTNAYKCTSGTGANDLVTTGDTISARSGMAVVYDSNNRKAYLFGGDSRVDNKTFYNEIYQFEPFNNYKITKLTTVSNISLLDKRAYAKAVFDPGLGKIYLFGGSVCTVSTGCPSGSGSTLKGDVLMFDPAGTGALASVITSSAVFSARQVKGAVFDELNHSAYLLGSVGSVSTWGGTNRTDVVRFNTEDKSIALTGKTVPEHFGGSVLANGRIFTFGGEDAVLSTAIYAVNLTTPTTAGPSASGVNISKTLIPVERLGADGVSYQGVCNTAVSGDPNCFNPYALQKGDVIKVSLEITLLPLSDPGSATVTDTALGIKYGDSKGLKCNPNNNAGFGAPTPLGATITGTNDVVWTNISVSSATPARASYYCTVE